MNFLQNTVTRLRPRIADYGVAVQAFLSGDSSFCIEALSTDATPQAAALQARSLSRLERFSEAAVLLDGIDVTQLSHEYAAELLAIRGSISVAMHDPSIEAILTEARARAYSSGFKPVECEVEILAGLVAWSQCRADDAATACERVLEIGKSTQWFLAAQRTDYLFTAAYWCSRAYDLLGFIHAGREDYASQAASLMRAFDEYDTSGVADTTVELRMLANFAVLVRDLDSDSFASFVEERAERVAWNAHTAAAESAIYHSIGLNRAKRGDHLGAFRHLRRSANCAPTVPLQIKAIIDRSFIAREIGEVLSAQDDFEHALRLAKHTDWENVPGMQRSVLFELAGQLAPIDAVKARVLWNRYASLKSAVSGFHIAGRGDRRQRAFECCAHAAVLASESQSGRAVSLLLESLEIFTEVGYRWRAAAVALDLAELTGEARYIAIAEREAAKYPNSSLARRVAALKASAPV